MSRNPLKPVAVIVVVLAAPTVAAAAGLNVVRHGPMLQAAFKAAYGETRSHHMTIGTDGDFTLTPSALIHTREGFFLVAAASMDSGGCHVCESGVAVTGFADDHGHPGKMTGQEPLISGGTGFNTPTVWRLDRGYTQYPALLVEGGWRGQGCRSHGVGIVELAPDGPHSRLDYLAEAKDIEDFGDAYGGEHVVGRRMSAHAGQGFVMHYAGWTHPGGYRRLALDITVTYRPKNGRLVPDKVVDDLTC